MGKKQADLKTDLRSGALDRAGIPGANRHIFLCIGPDCCASADGEALWKHVKKRIRETDIPVMRTKAGCFRICQGGPWMVVYPDGTWYGNVTPDRFDRILEIHLIGGEPVAEWIAMVNTLQLRPPH